MDVLGDLRWAYGILESLHVLGLAWSRQEQTQKFTDLHSEVATWEDRLGLFLLASKPEVLPCMPPVKVSGDQSLVSVFHLLLTDHVRLQLNLSVAVCGDCFLTFNVSNSFDAKAFDIMNSSD